MQEQDLEQANKPQDKHLDYSSENIQITESSRVSKWWLFLVIVAVVFLGVYGFQQLNQNVSPSITIEQPSETIERQIKESVAAGDKTESVKLYDELIEASDDQVEKTRLNIAKAYSLFNRGKESDKGRAIENLKTIINDPASTDMLRALATNAMLDLYYIDRSEETLENIAFGENLYFISNEKGNKMAAKSLADFSISAAPTSAGFRFAAFWYAGEILDNADLTADEKKQFVSDLLVVTEKSISLFPKEIHRYEVLETALANHFTGFLYGTVATFDKDQGQEFEVYFQKVLDLASANPTDFNLKSVTVYTNFYYAAFLDRVYGVERAEDVQGQIDQLVAAMQRYNSDESKEADKFITFLKRELARPEDDRDHNYEFITRLAEIDPEFEALLSEV